MIEVPKKNMKRRKRYANKSGKRKEIEPTCWKRNEMKSCRAPRETNSVHSRIVSLGQEKDEEKML